MKQAIVNFCKSMDTGLFLLDMPTGFGKTYSVLDFMVDNYDAPEFKDRTICRSNVAGNAAGFF